MLQSLTTADFDEKVGSAEGVVVVKYGAEWCGACNDIVPVLEEVIATADVPFYEVDIDAEPELKTRAGVELIIDKETNVHEMFICSNCWDAAK